MNDNNGHEKIWGQRKTVFCPSGQRVKLRLFSVLDLVARGVIPLEVIDAPINTDNPEVPLSSDEKIQKRLKDLHTMRAMIEAGVDEPRIGVDVPWEEIPTSDRTFLSNEITDWMRQVGGLAAVTADRPFHDGK